MGRHNIDYISTRYKKTKGYRVVRCKACGERFQDNQELIKHYKRVHKGLSIDHIKELV